MALPSHQPVRNALVPASEPVAHLESLHLAISWVAPTTRVSPTATGAPSSPPATEPTREAGSSQLHAYQSLLRAEVLSQVGTGMKKVLRMQMVRRFPYIFDGDFLEYQSSLAFPAAILDAMNRFLTLSARHNTSLLPKCKALFDTIDETQSNTMMRRIDAMARLQTKRPYKRSKTDSQPTQNQMEDAEEDERAEKIVAARQRQRLLDENMSAEAKLRRSLPRGVTEIGAAKWMRARTGMGKLAAWRLVEAKFYEDDEDARLVNQEDQASPSCWEMLGPMDDEYDPFPSLPPNSPPPAPPEPRDLRLDLFGSDDEYDDLDAEEPGPVANVAPGHAIYEPCSTFGSHTPDKPLNALLLDLGLGHLCKPTGFGAFNHATLEVPNSETSSEHPSSLPRNARTHDLFRTDVAEESDNDLDDIRESPRDHMDDDVDDLATLYSGDDTDNDLESFYSDIDSPRSEHEAQDDLDCLERRVEWGKSPSHASQVSDVFGYCNMESLSLNLGSEDGNDLDDEAGEAEVAGVRDSGVVLDGDTNYEASYTDDLDVDDGECDALDMSQVYQQEQQQSDPETVNDLDDDDTVWSSVSHRLVGDLWHLPHFSPSQVVVR